VVRQGRLHPPPDAPSLAELRAVQAHLRGVTRAPALLASPTLSALAATEVLLVAEHRQVTGSFKARGARAFTAALDPDVRARGLVAASAGNHAQGVALAARSFGVPCTIFMPAGAPAVKRRATAQLGAEVRLVPSGVDACLALARQHAASTGGVFVHPFDDRSVVMGQATLGLEVLDERPDVVTLVAPAAGGGLLAGLAAAVHASGSPAEVVGVQPMGAAALYRSLTQGRRLTLDAVDTIADGLRVTTPGGLPARWVAALAHRVDRVPDRAIRRAMRHAARCDGCVLEPAGATALAAVLATPRRFSGPVAIVLSGSNVDLPRG
jgi:threonine dehydratase